MTHFTKKQNNVQTRAVEPYSDFRLWLQLWPSNFFLLRIQQLEIFGSGVKRNF